MWLGQATVYHTRYSRFRIHSDTKPRRSRPLFRAGSRPRLANGPQLETSLRMIALKWSGRQVKIIVSSGVAECCSVVVFRFKPSWNKLPCPFKALPK